MEQELANQQALVQVKSAEPAKQQQKIATEEKHLNSKKRLLAQGKTQCRLAGKDLDKDESCGPNICSQHHRQHICILSCRLTFCL